MQNSMSDTFSVAVHLALSLNHNIINMWTVLLIDFIHCSKQTHTHICIHTRAIPCMEQGYLNNLLCKYFVSIIFISQISEMATERISSPLKPQSTTDEAGSEPMDSTWPRSSFRACIWIASDQYLGDASH